jgi:type I restriction enzyme M protein
LSAGRYRPLAQSQVEHRDPKELLDELAAIETEIMEEIEGVYPGFPTDLWWT